MTHLVLLHDSNRVSNIGNAFFTAGVKYLLAEVCGESTVLSAPSKVSGGWRLRGSLNVDNDIDYIQYSQCDWFVLSGPMLDRNFARTYAKTFERVFSKGRAKLILLSVGGIEYSKQEVNECRAFLTDFRPHVLFTRDAQTFENYNDLASYSHDGVCNAFFAPDYYPGYDTPDLNPYIACAFDNSREPEIAPGELVAENIDSYEGPSARFKQINRLQMLRNQSVPDRLGQIGIVRPNHNVMRLPAQFLMRKKNTFIAQSYEGYLNIYRNAVFTLTDRVHACVAALAYGRRARLYTDSKRAYLLKRAGAENALRKLTYLDQDFIKQEKARVIDALKAAYRGD